MSAMLTSWKTSLMGLAVLICTGNVLIGVLGPKGTAILNGLCGIAIAYGLIAAKDADKSNAPSPVETAKKVE